MIKMARTKGEKAPVEPKETKPKKTTIKKPKEKVPRKPRTIKPDTEDEKVLAKASYQRCPMCGKIKLMIGNNFYKSSSPLFEGNPEGRMCWCKNCINELYKNIFKECKSETKAIYEVCQRIDAYFYRGLIDTMKQKIENEELSKETCCGWYLGKVTSLPAFAKKTFRDSDPLEDIEVIQNEANVVTTEKQLIKKWGDKYSLEDLVFLEEHYAEWEERIDTSKLQVQKLIIRICTAELQLTKVEPGSAREEAIERRLMGLMDKANLTPKSMSKLDGGDSNKVYGVWIRDIEQTRPAEYFQDKKLYEDYDGLLEYFNRFILRPLKNLLLGTREFDFEFNLEKDDENIEIPEIEEEEDYQNLEVTDDDINYEAPPEDGEING